MHYDIVIPRGNEKEFVRMAELLEYDCLYLCYSPSGLDTGKEIIASLPKTIIVKPLLLITDRKHSHWPEQRILKLASHQDLRTCLEQLRPSFILDIESSAGKDTTHTRTSQLNHVLCAIAKKYHTTFCFSLTSYFSSSAEKRSRLLGKVQQNIRLCSKYDVAYDLVSLASSPEHMRNPLDVKALTRMLSKR